MLAPSCAARDEAYGFSGKSEKKIPDASHDYRQGKLLSPADTTLLADVHRMQG
jgi:hypothetical protein